MELLQCIDLNKNFGKKQILKNVNLFFVKNAKKYFEIVGIFVYNIEQFKR